MKYTQIPSSTFEQIQLNAGIVCTGFNPATGAVSGVLGATTGGMQFNATQNFTDFGDDIDNCPKNMKELKKIESIDVSLAGTLVTIDAAGAKRLMSAADIDGNDATHIIPRNDVLQSDFQDIWWVGDYSDVNTGDSAGFCAIHIMNSLNTGGFQIKSTDKGKGNFAFTFTGHYSMAAQDTVPYEVYIKSGSGTLAPSIQINTDIVNVGAEGTAAVNAITTPANATVTWTTVSSTVATVAAGTDTHNATVTGGDSAGSTTLNASITVDGITYSDVATIIVSASEG